MCTKSLSLTLFFGEGCSSYERRDFIAKGQVLSLPRRGFRAEAFLLLLLLSNFCFAQTNFSLLQLPSNAFQQALGEKQITAKQPNSLTFGQNPALLDSSQQQVISFSYSPLYSQANYFGLAYTWKSSENRYWAVGSNIVTWGSFQGRDAVGNATNNFSAGDVAISVAHARQMGNFRLGVSSKIASSFIETYQTVAFLVDGGGIFQHPTKDFSVGFTIQNIGFPVYRYASVPLVMPFDIRIGATFKPTYMPARISVVADKLYEMNTLAADASLTKQLVSHLAMGSEFILHPNFRVLIGFNFRKNYEMKLQQNNRTGGFSYGMNYVSKKWGLCLSRQTALPQVGRWLFDFYWKLH